VEIQGAVQDVQAQKTLLDFLVLPGDEAPGIEKEGETVQVKVLQGETMIASISFCREADDSLTTETEHINLTFIPH